ncbi:hypothetical protein [Streptomyces kronopolitis]|uniref:hypothetical protein n=1 Tax=Streptomyces kronopolitis TaxID=1612435 RepID=UPI00367EB029
MDLRSTKPALLGEPDGCGMTLTVEWDADGGHELEFAFERLPFFTRRAVKVLTLLAAGLIAGVVLWLSPVGGKATSRTQALPGPSQQKQKEEKKPADKAPKQKTLQRPASVQTAKGTRIDEYRVPEGYELRLSDVSVKVAGPDNGTRQLSAHQGRGTEVGKLSSGSGRAQVSVPVILQSDLAEPAFVDRLTRWR